jgi:hypothetical protein
VSGFNKAILFEISSIAAMVSEICLSSPLPISGIIKGGWGVTTEANKGIKSLLT